MIPKIIHQIWLSDLEEMPEAWQASPGSWQLHHPDWEYRLWRHQDVVELLESRYPEYLRMWKTLPYLVAQVDMARYLILLTFGGIYSDHDIICNRPLDDLLEHQVVLPATKPFGVSNDFMMTEPGTPLFQSIVTKLPQNLRLWNRFFVPPYLRVMAGVGSLYVSACYWSAEKGSVHLLPPEHYSSQSTHAFVHHIEGNSWGSWDSALIRQVYHRRHQLGAAAVALVAFLIWRKR